MGEQILSRPFRRADICGSDQSFRRPDPHFSPDRVIEDADLASESPVRGAAKQLLFHLRPKPEPDRLTHRRAGLRAGRRWLLVNRSVIRGLWITRCKATRFWRQHFFWAS